MNWQILPIYSQKQNRVTLQLYKKKAEKNLRLLDWLSIILGFRVAWLFRRVRKTLVGRSRH